MTNADGTTGAHSVQGWWISLLLVAVGAVYLSAFWGNAAALLPEPLNAWGTLCRRPLGVWYRQSVTLMVAVQFVIGLVVPAVLMKLGGRRLTDVGIGMPNVLGWRLVLVSAAISVPFGLWLLAAYPNLARQPLITKHHLGGLLAIIPEHFLICGVYVAVLLPGRRFPDRVPVAATAGPLVTRVLRWLGLAQPAPPGANRVLAWFGLTAASLFAIVASGVLFAMVHVGKAALELVLSLPGGVAVAYVTLRSRSIWPAVLAHWTMNLVPLGLLHLLR